MSTPVSINDAKVQAIVSSYTGIEILHPVVSDMCDDPEFKRMFWLCLSHDLEVISQRSQDLADGEVTANQKAFKVLMENEDSEGAVEIYVDEILGLKFSSDAMKAQTLATALQTKDYIMNCAFVPLNGLTMLRH